MMTEQAGSTAISTARTQPQPPGIVFWRCLRDNRGGILAWGLGYTALLVMIAVLYPILESRSTLMGVLGGLGLLDMIAENYVVDTRALGTFPGYLALEALAWGPLILSVYIIPNTLRALIGEEEDGTLDLLLSTPLTRSQLLIEKMAALLCSLGLILLIMWAGLLISTQLIEGSDITLGQASAGIWHLLPISLVLMMGTLLLSVLLRSARSVGGLAAMWVLASFFTRSLADATDTPALEILRHASVFAYYSSIGAMIDGITPANDLGLLLVAGVLFGLALRAFRRRDLGI